MLSVSSCTTHVFVRLGAVFLGTLWFGNYSFRRNVDLYFSDIKLTNTRVSLQIYVMCQLLEIGEIAVFDVSVEVNGSSGKRTQYAFYTLFLSTASTH